MKSKLNDFDKKLTIHDIKIKYIENNNFVYGTKYNMELQIKKDSDEINLHETQTDDTVKGNAKNSFNRILF